MPRLGTEVDPPPIPNAITRFVASGIAVLLLVGVGATLFLRRQSEQEALRDARERTRIMGSGIVQPLLTDQVLAGKPSAIKRLDRVVKDRVLGNPVVRVKIWSRTGRILYSDEHRLIGQRFPLGDEDVGILSTDRVEAEVSDLGEPENRFERDQGELLEVYMSLWARDGEPVLFETYLQSEAIVGDQRRLLLQFLPLLLTALALLWLTQLPLVRSMSHRLREGQLERERLLRRAIEASDTERRRVAHDLHDGVIQDLAGLSYELSAAADVAARAGSSDLADRFGTASDTTRRSIRQLRSLLIDVYPPNLHTAGLPAVLRDLASSIQARGMNVEMEIDEEIQLPPQTEAHLFRVAQESVRNAMAHSKADFVRVELSKTDSRVVLCITDDGAGFSEHERAQRANEGHMGLQLLDELMTHSGIHLEIESEPGRGTKVRAEVSLS